RSSGAAGRRAGGLGPRHARAGRRSAARADPQRPGPTPAGAGPGATPAKVMGVRRTRLPADAGPGHRRRPILPRGYRAPAASPNRQIAANSSASRLAPPTRAPSMSRSAMIPAMLLAFTEPP